MHPGLEIEYLHVAYFIQTEEADIYQLFMISAVYDMCNVLVDMCSVWKV